MEPRQRWQEISPVRSCHRWRGSASIFPIRHGGFARPFRTRSPPPSILRRYRGLPVGMHGRAAMAAVISGRISRGNRIARASSGAAAKDAVGEQMPQARA